ncbi:MAG: hypothetical protein AAFN77_03725 [Planctomycetota bacterium]
MTRFLLTSLLASYLFFVAESPQNLLAQDGEPKAAAKSKNDEEAKALEAKLAKYLSGTKWVGNFTMGDDKMRTERYEILSAEKSEYGDKWNLIARIKYGDKDMSFALPPIDIKFAGNTPVITVDKVFFPGFGTFDARVVIRRGKYAGTWQHDKVGGHLFGTITKMSDEELEESKKRVAEIKPKTDSSEKASDSGSDK